MFVTRRNPSEAWWSGLDWFQDEMNRLFDRFEGGVAPGQAGGYPPVNVWEDTDHLYVEAELPGLQLDKLELYVTEGNQLSLRGVRQPPQAEKGLWHRQERG